jgi:hypothetical protein
MVYGTNTFCQAVETDPIMLQTTNKAARALKLVKVIPVIPAAGRARIPNTTRRKMYCSRLYPVINTVFTVSLEKFNILK